ncbi:MAG: hypothetical protein ABFD04_11620 [Syntrophomonas sp.]
MDITIKIEAPALVDAINTLAVAFAGNIELLLDGPGARIKAEAPLTKAEIKEQVDQENAISGESAPKKTEASTFTLEQVRAKLADLSRGGKQAEVKALLNKLGAKKLTEVPEEKYPELMKEAEAI